MLFHSLFEGDDGRYLAEAFMEIADSSISVSRVVFLNPYTIVTWKDGEETVVKCGSSEAFDKEKGLAMAISKRFLGSYTEFESLLDSAVVLYRD